MRSCPRCRQAVEDGTVECPLCGEYLPEAPSGWSLFDRGASRGRGDVPPPDQGVEVYEDVPPPADGGFAGYYEERPRPAPPGARPGLRLDRRSPVTIGVAALLLVVLTGAVVRAVSSDDVTTASRETASGEISGSRIPPEEGQEPVPTFTTDEPAYPTDPDDGSVPTLQDAVVSAGVTAPSGVDAGGGTVTYDPANMIDGDPATTWRMPDDGRGAQIRLEFREPVTITRAGLINGYAKVDPWNGVDRYDEERRILSVTWWFDGQQLNQELTDGVRDLQYLELDPVQASVVTLQIDDVTAPGDPERDYTAISELDLEISG